MSTAQRKRPAWATPAATIALVGFAGVVPVVAFGGVLGSTSWFGGEQSPSQVVASYAWGLTGTISFAIALTLGIVAAIAGRRAARVLVCITVPLALIGLYVFGAITASADRNLPHAEAPPSSTVPDCGPGSRPPVYGGDSRYEPCDPARRVADELLPAISAALPADDVTAERVDAVADSLAADGLTPHGIYEGAHRFENGDVVAGWVPAPVTCILAEWQGGEWTLRVTGVTVDGHGCVYTQY